MEWEVMMYYTIDPGHTNVKRESMMRYSHPASGKTCEWLIGRYDR